MKNIEYKERFIPLNIIKYLIKQKEEIEQKLNKYPILYCNKCGDTNPNHGFYPLLSSFGITCNRCRLSDEEYENIFNCKKEIIENICKIYQEDLHELYNDGNDIFKLDEFEFIGEDNNIYIFDVTNFNYLCGEYGNEHIIDTIHCGINDMLDKVLCKLK